LVAGRADIERALDFRGPVSANAHDRRRATSLGGRTHRQCRLGADRHVFLVDDDEVEP